MPLRRKKFILALQPHEALLPKHGTSWSPLAFGVVLLVLMGLAFSTPPIFISQSPSDITSLNVVNVPLIIQYNLTGTGNNTTALLWYKSNGTTNPCSAIINGTCESDWENESVSSTSGNTLNFTLYDNEIYPHTENYNDPIFRNTTHVATTILASGSEYHKTQFMNVSNISEYGFVELMFTSTTATPVRVYTCNSTFTTGNVNSNANCVQIGNVIANGAYDHCHTDPATGANNSCHRVIVYTINKTTGTVNGIKVTSNMTFIIRGNTGATVTPRGLGVNVRAGAEQFSANNGNTWSPIGGETFTIDGHLHQYEGNDTFYYYACAEGATDCSATRNDTFDLAPLCTATFEWQPTMTPDGLIITRYTNAATTWLAQFTTTTQNVAGCFLNVTAYASTGNGTVFSTLSVSEIGNITQNHTNVPINNTINLWSVAFLTNGSNITLASRQYYMIGMPKWIGENMLGELLILSGVALIYIAFRKEKEAV
jgi:hypothetical protein